VAYAVSILTAKNPDFLVFQDRVSFLDVHERRNILDIKSKPKIGMLTPPKFANDLVSGIENGSEGCIVESAMIQRFFRPTHANRWLNFSGKKTEQTREKFAKGHFGKVVCLGGLYISNGTFRCMNTKAYSHLMFLWSAIMFCNKHRELYYEKI